MTQKIRLDRLLSNLGYGPRRQIQSHIRKGKFVLNGRAISDPSEKIEVSKDALTNATYEGEPLEHLAPMVIKLHKPAGYVCAHHDEDGLSIFHLLPERFRLRTPTLTTVGRLDKDTTGLILCSDGGDIIHALTHPKNHIEKEYHVTLADPLSGEEVDIFASGTLMLRSEDKPLLPATLKQIDAKTCSLILHEGRYHQVKRMFAALGNKVESLHRTRVGALTLDGLEEGAWEYLSEEELEKLLN